MSYAQKILRFTYHSLSCCVYSNSAYSRCLNPTLRSSKYRYPKYQSPRYRYLRYPYTKYPYFRR